MDITNFSAFELSQQIKTKTLSCREVMQAFLDRIHAENPKINAIIELLEEKQALALADKADEDISKGRKLGSLHGLPIALKEMVDVKGWRTTYCWEAGAEEQTLAGFGTQAIIQKDSLLAARMRKSGLIFIGKTNMPEFAFGSHTKNDLFGITRNPYNLNKTVGGSSGGAAAALATNMLPLADGSDLGGSLRNPAAFCGVVGFRPSIGRVPKLEAGWAARLSTEGPMARTVQDVAFLLAVQAGTHIGDPLSIRHQNERFEGSLKKDVKGMRIGWTADFGHLPVEKEVVEVCEKSLSMFKDLGVDVTNDFPDIMKEEKNQGLLHAMDVFRILRVLAIAPIIRAFRKNLGKKGIRAYLNSNVQYQFLEAYDQVDAEAIYLANENRQRIYQQFLSFFEKHDFLVCPTTQVLPFNVETDYVRSINGQAMNDYLEWMSICCILSITGLPIISIPCGKTENGLPVGIQIVGKPGRDLEVLEIAAAVEKAGLNRSMFL